MVGIVSGNLASFTRANLAASEKETKITSEQISTGSKLVNSLSDPAGIAIGTGLRVDSSSLTVALSNTSQANSINQIASGATENIQSLLERGRNLAVQASGSALQETELGFLQQEFEAILKEVDNIAQNTNFNGQALLNNTDGFTFQVGTKAEQNITLETNNLTLSNLFESVPSIASQEDAKAAISFIDEAIQTVSEAGAGLAASASSLSSAADSIEVAIQNYEASKSLFLDTDIGASSENYLKELVSNDVNTALLAFQNEETLRETISLLDE